MKNVLMLFIAAAIFEWFVLGHIVFWLQGATASWPMFPLLLALAMPRFVTMLVLVGVLGRFQQRSSTLIFLALYAGLLLVRFDQAEAFVNWDSTIAASRATVPYVAGLLGAILALWMTRRSVALRDVAGEKPEHG